MLKYLEMETAPNPTASIIWLHGLGADGYDFEPIVPELGLPASLAVRFIFPHAPQIPVTINGGYVMPAWYDIKADNIEGRQDIGGIQVSAKDIQQLIEQEKSRGITADNIILAGFSQGGAMALYVGTHQQQALAGILALSCYTLLPDDQPTEAAKATPVMQMHGIGDDIVPIHLGNASHEYLRQAGFQVDYKTYPMTHSLHPQQIKHIGEWLTSRLGRLTDLVGRDS